jgi:hypothetical protein
MNIPASEAELARELSRECRSPEFVSLLATRLRGYDGHELLSNLLMVLLQGNTISPLAVARIVLKAGVIGRPATGDAGRIDASRVSVQSTARADQSGADEASAPRS